ncbi:MAG: hypothetical protein BGN98_04315 [Microbacterium sp. 69-7]|uniref:hypothetical protein n=1 Tax=unclassified Microbacterium TaxID=2609290 RepID=UPI000445B900|nr:MULTISPECIES: hypothetical protein [unclassified Microbacterium]EXJ52556.1 membrane protein [Microbacterium sp. MRS-1]ODT25209.1 MAG: hypothetical protein ABS64_02420 [Microbacterium sp. SCN 69-37]OJU47167.1 MAG: hypothetical protein BGN98_04315 [Microbacterium sp. 69-7]
MITFLLRAAVFLASAAVGLIVADIVLPGFSSDWRSPVGFILVIVIFAVLQSVLAPWLARVAQRNAPAFLGGIGIVAPMIVWVVTAIAAFLLPAVLLKKKVQDRRES